MPITVNHLPHQATARLSGGSGPLMPQHIAVVVVDEPEISPYDVKMEVGVLHGRPICTSFTAVQRDGGPPVTRKGLNSTQVEKLIRKALTGTDAGPLMRSTPLKTGGWRVTPLSRADARDAYKATQPKRGARGDPAERQRKIEQVAAMYRDLIAAGIRQPKPPIAETLYLSASYVGALLAEARKQGLVPPAPERGRASLAPTEPHSVRPPRTQQNPPNQTSKEGTQ